MTLNAIVSIGFFLILIVIFIIFISGSSDKEKNAAVKYSLSDLADGAVDWISAYTNDTLIGLGLERRDLIKQQEHRKSIARQVRNCCSGSEGARETTKGLIKQYLSDVTGARELREVLSISETSPSEVLFTCLMTKFNAESKKNDGFSKFISLIPDYASKGEISREDLVSVFRASSRGLPDDNVIETAVQLIYAKKFGFGCIDLLNYDAGTIEEIQIGLSGTGVENVRYRDKLSGNVSDLRHSRDSVHIVNKGRVVWLSFLSFGTDAEMRRVIRNLIKCTNAGELTQADPYKIVDTIDGRRVTVMRPGASDAWAGFVRKFDTVEECDLAALYKNLGDSDTLIRTIRKIIVAGGSIVVDGPMGSGKTTLLRALFKEILRSKSIRTIEDQSFEISLRRYLSGRNVTSIRVTDYLSSQDALGLIKKTSGQILGAGEITTPDVADMFLNLCKFSEQAFTTAHYTSTDELVGDLTNARLCHGYTNERLAEIDVVQSINFNIHLTNRNGVRLVDYIDEIVPALGDEISKEYENSLEGIRHELAKTKMYTVRPIIRYNWVTKRYDVLNDLSERFCESYRINIGLYDIKNEVAEC